MATLGTIAAIGAGSTHTLAVEGIHTVVTTYTNDARGNRLTKTTGPTSTSFAYDSADRITVIGTATVDGNGNLTASGIGGRTFAYDVANRLVSLAISGTPSTSYVYHGDGKRASKTVSETTTSCTYDVGGSLPNLLTNGTLTYVYGLGLAYTVDGANNVQVFQR